MVDRLPEGMIVGDFNVQDFYESTFWKCTIEPGVGGLNAGQATCTNTTALPANTAYKPIVLPVLVTLKAHNPSINEATLTEEGTPPVKATEEGTEVTPALPLGISKFTAKVLKVPDPFSETLTEPFSEAGGHPFAVTTELVLNYTPSSENGEGTLEESAVVAAGGGAKEIQVELPPGFVGNPQNKPLCPIAVFEVEPCPESTAVGFAQVGKQPKISHGKAQLFLEPEAAKGQNTSGLVYGLQPTTGHPAEFGFIVGGGIPFVLDAKLRSDGDYGVTVGDSAVGQKPVSTKVTFCQSGAAGGRRLPAGEGGYYCKPPTALRPYLTNIVQCPSAPSWTVLANAWYEPSDYVSQTVGQDPAVTCPGELGEQHPKSLPFNPGLEFQPSPPEFKAGSTTNEGGTKQADKPTGIDVGLTLPQGNESEVNGTPELKDVKMTLPAGMTISPAAADGLQACTNADFGLGTEFEAGGVKLPSGMKPTEPANPAHCPAASQVGTVEVFTPLLSGAPTMEGSAKAGDVLKCSQGTWSNGAWHRNLEQHEAGVEELENGNKESLKLTYEWLRDGEIIAGAAANQYVVQKADEGRPLQCAVTASNAAGSSVALSRETVAIPLGEHEPTLPIRETKGKKELEAAPEPPVAPPSIAAPSGTPSVGNALTCASGVWTGEPEPFTYQWLRNGVAIADATEGSYMLTSEDVGKVIQCQVTGKRKEEVAIGVGGSEKVVVGNVVSADSAAVVVPSSVASSAPPLPGGALQGQLYVGEPECNPCTEANHDAADGRIFRLFLQAQDPAAGVVVKLFGTTSVNEETGQLTTTFVNQPQQPFELLQVKLKGGPGATLANPQTCGKATTIADLTPWSSPFTADATPESSFAVEGCSATMPFSPSFNAGTEGANATAAGTNPSEFSATFSRQDGEQDLSSITVHMPLGLVGKIAGTPLCGEAQANAGTCGPESQIGTATAYAGAGSEPYAYYAGGST